MKYKSELLGATVYPELDVIFFYGGIFSQWAECKFHCTALNLEVNCAEQAMMLHKAKFFKDQEIYDAILATDHPRDQKALGRMVKNFDPMAWETVAFNYVKDINVDKFGQNKGWKELLFLTDPYHLVEASPTDRIWGIGMGEDNPDILNDTKWGRNLLGEAIVQARVELMFPS
jgi:ribA/ribD-fused uncharacterized protein